MSDTNEHIDSWTRYAEAGDFFSLRGSIVMKLTTEAAVGACEQAAQQGLLISRIEGGIWHTPGFEARIDCIWDGAEPPLDVCGAPNSSTDYASIKAIAVDMLPAKMKSSVEKLFDVLLGQAVWSVRHTHGSCFFMEFGNPHREVREPLPVRDGVSPEPAKDIFSW